jgi:hypothetical protein
MSSLPLMSSLTSIISVLSIVKTKIVPPVVDPTVLLWYDLSDATTRQTSGGAQVTTNNTAIYKILDKSRNNYHLFNLLSNSTTKLLNTNGFASEKMVVQTSGTASQCGFKTTGTSPPIDKGLTFFFLFQPLGGASSYKVQWSSTPSN